MITLRSIMESVEESRDMGFSLDDPIEVYHLTDGVLEVTNAYCAKNEERHRVLKLIVTEVEGAK